ncbi:hypothetical protein PGTUg99_026083 [Puccinia graminis f. sp. tritici]|uniref:Uncharacterized protein n=1 Tax=Puccinia graminis f. sp. tritici TaxID=56615 RepID=A0A5B0SE00_PUCGR|nr:hypothetical protein PGTUg99_026083 [Puccinia graminis f. sp. tritici]
MTPHKFTGFRGSSDLIPSPKLRGPGPAQFGIPEVRDDALFWAMISADRTTVEHWNTLEEQTL